MDQESFKEILPEIAAYFDSRGQKILRYAELNRILSDKRELWGLEKTKVDGFIDLLIKHKKLEKTKFTVGRSRVEARYLWGDASEYELALSAYKKSYFTHHTALYLNAITAQVPNAVYVNHEQPKHNPPGGELSQEGIDRAFQNACRVSNSTIEYKGKIIRILNGKNTGMYGVFEAMVQGMNLPVTNIPRALVDATVRPIYSGGVSNVLAAYRLARGKYQVSELIEILDRFQYVYPYHQAIGFYLDFSGVYDESEFQPFLGMDRDFDFYLANQIENPAYSEKWRIYYPPDIKPLVGQ